RAERNGCLFHNLTFLLLRPENPSEHINHYSTSVKKNKSHGGMLGANCIGIQLRSATLKPHSAFNTRACWENTTCTHATIALALPRKSNGFKNEIHWV
ncbi:MAG: hypothetical protein IKT85_02000, partial [Kiritimatiellae bacterium]|nr:hypothetical protein [Kiritimatiellia bacterium]